MATDGLTLQQMLCLVREESETRGPLRDSRELGLDYVAIAEQASKLAAQLFSGAGEESQVVRVPTIRVPSRNRFSPPLFSPPQVVGFRFSNEELVAPVPIRAVASTKLATERGS